MSRGSARSQARRQSGTTVALFPFLAVLVCTMGALIVVLVVLARQSRMQAANAAAAMVDATQNELASAREIAQWRVSELEQILTKTRSEVSAERLRLGHIENHSRQLRERLDLLEAARKDLAAAQTAALPARAEREDELTRLRRELARAEADLQDAKRRAHSRPASYAVVSYQGPHGVRRRPIYLECQADAIVLQPEGIRFLESDFEPPLRANNALDRAVRAVRQAMLAQGEIRGDGSDEPYPLLLIRPSGSGAYYAARAALESWKGELGYELIGDDWNLTFPAPNASLAQAVRSAVDQARAEQRDLRMLVNAGATPHAQPTYRAAPGGGLIREEPAETDRHGGFQATKPASRFAGNYRPDDEGSPPQRPDGTVPAPRSQRRQTPADANAPSSVRRPGEWVEQAPRSSQTSADEKSSQQKTKSMAETRGKNWRCPTRRAARWPSPARSASTAASIGSRSSPTAATRPSKSSPSNNAPSTSSTPS